MFALTDSKELPHNRENTKVTMTMRRVREFTVRFNVGQTQEVRRYQSWHQVCNVIAKALRDDGDEVIVQDSPKFGFIIARFTAKLLKESEESLGIDQNRSLWRSERFNSEGDTQVWNVHYNVHQYYWEWIEGASREVPFRLSYFERSAQQFPNGICAWWLTLLAEWRDRLMIRA